jgi:hypothetical protein
MEKEKMPDEKVAKWILNAQDTSVQDAVEAARRQFEPMIYAVRALENSEFEKIVQNTKAVSMHFSSFLDQEWVNKLAALETRFRLPTMPEKPEMINKIEAIPRIEKLYVGAFKLEEAIERMRVPWLDSYEQMRSVTGFAGGARHRPGAGNHPCLR